MKDLKSRLFGRILTVTFYIALLLLAVVLIYPYTSFYYSEPFFIPFHKKLNEHDVILEQGKSFRLYPLSLQKKVSYESSDFKVAEVNNTGKVAARRTGQVIIRVKTGKGISKCRVRVVRLNYKKIVIKKGKSSVLKVAGYGGAVTFKSKDQSIAVVEKNGRICGMKKGRTYVTASVKKVKLSCEVIVE